MRKFEILEIWSSLAAFDKELLKAQHNSLSVEMASFHVEFISLLSKICLKIVEEQVS